MARTNVSIRRPGPAGRKRTRGEKIGLGVSIFAFFGAVGVVAWFGITGIGSHDDERQLGPLVFAGGDVSSSQAGAAPAADDEDGRVPDDEYFVGNFGEPVAELYADDDDAGWGEAAVERSGDIEERPERPHREGRIRRGQGGV